MITQNDLAMFGAAKNPDANVSLVNAKRVVGLLKAVGIEGEVKINCIGARGPQVMPMVGVDEVEGGVDENAPYNYVLVVGRPAQLGQTTMQIARIHNSLNRKDDLGRYLETPYQVAMRCWDEVASGVVWSPMTSSEEVAQGVVDSVNKSYVRPD